MRFLAEETNAGRRRLSLTHAGLGKLNPNGVGITSLTLSVQNDVDLRLRTGSCLSLTVTNPTSFGNFLKLKTIN